jgi:hypothetical protein
MAVKRKYPSCVSGQGSCGVPVPACSKRGCRRHMAVAGPTGRWLLDAGRWTLDAGRCALWVAGGRAWPADVTQNKLSRLMAPCCFE